MLIVVSEYDGLSNGAAVLENARCTAALDGIFVAALAALEGLGS